MSIKWLALILSSGVFLAVIELIRRRLMTFKYALSWLAASLVAISLSVFDGILPAVARCLGFVLPSNLIFFLIGLTLVILSLTLTVYLCQQNSRIEIIAQRLSILEAELARLKR